MEKNAKKTDKQTRRTEIKDLPRDEQELSTDEQKEIQGGATRVVTPGIRTTTSEPPPVPPFCGI